MGSRTIGKETYYSVKNDRGEAFTDMTDKELFNFFKDQTPMTNKEAANRLTEMLKSAKPWQISKLPWPPHYAG